MEYSREEIANVYKKLKEYLGHQPSSGEFYKETDITEYQLIKNFGSKAYFKLVQECGDIPNTFAKPKSDLEEILIQWGELARRENQIPTTADWTYHKLKPTVSRIKTSHGFNFSDLPYKFLEYAIDKPHWKDVIDLVPTRDLAKENSPNTKSEKLSYEFYKFLPPVVQDLIDLSTDENKAIEFEKSVALAFQILGFEVEYLGQGSGRNPDSIAKAMKNRYAVLIDAKNRRNQYQMGTEDRKFIEYINKYKEILNKAGYEIIYFLIVSSDFNSVPEIALKNIKRETGVDTTLITAQSLLKVLAKKIEYPNRFDLNKLKELFIQSGLINEKVILKILKG